MSSTKSELRVTRRYNSETQEDFTAVENDQGHGCDVYDSGEIQDWQDGNGLLAHGEATEAQVRNAAASTVS